MALRHLEIKNFGPLKDVKVDLKGINLFTGPQSAGKSCLLKTACHCAWVEKRIIVTHNYESFAADGYFFTQLLDFYKMQGFEHNDTVIVYDSRYLHFQYEHARKLFSCSFKNNSLSEFRRAKLSYIPAERNIVSVVNNPMKLSIGENNMSSFISDWSYARKRFAASPLQILNLGVAYNFDEKEERDFVLIDGKRLPLSCASSGLQSLIPLLTYVNMLTNGKYDNESSDSIRIAENEKCLSNLYRLWQQSENGDKNYGRIIGQKMLYFNSEKDADEFEQLYLNHVQYQFSEFYLEEPEENLFPQTQYQLAKNLVKVISDGRHHSLSIATHSPYIMASFNNMLFAGSLIAQGKLDGDALVKLVGKGMFVSPDDLTAYEINDGSAKSIIDDETGLISADALDSASIDIEREFSKLLDLQ